MMNLLKSLIHGLIRRGRGKGGRFNLKMRGSLKV